MSDADRNIDAIIDAYAFADTRRHFMHGTRVRNRLGPADDAGMDDDGAAGPLEELLGLRVGIVYVDSHGVESEREVTVRAFKILPDEKGLALRCKCHARNAARMFYLSRVKSFYDIDTGEAFDDVEAFLRAFATGRTESASPSNSVAAAIAAVKTDLHVLIFLARCDGWHDSEVSVACNLVLDASTTPQGIDVAELERQIRMLDPDEWVFREALSAFVAGPAEGQRRLVRAIRRMVNSDGVLSPAEGRFLDDIAGAVGLAAHKEGTQP